jgi:hypothetical protein
MPRRDNSWVTGGAPVDEGDGPGGRAVASS